MINQQKYILKDSNDFKSRLEKLNELNFIELIQLWRELACHYRKIANDINATTNKKRNEKIIQIPKISYKLDIANVYVN